MYRYAAIKDCYGKAHYPTYAAEKDDKTIYFTITGTRIKLPQK